MCISKDLHLLESYCAKIISNKKLLISPDDLINETIIKLHDDGVEYSFDNFKKKVGGVSYRIKDSQPHIIELKESKRRIQNINQDIFCKGCKQNLPIQMFYMQKRIGNGQEYPYTLCKTCHNKMKWKQTKSNPISMKKSRQRGLKTYYKNKESRNEKSSKRKKCSICGRKRQERDVFLTGKIALNGSPSWNCIDTKTCGKIAVDRYR